MAYQSRRGVMEMGPKLVNQPENALVWSLISAKRRKKLTQEAARSRASIWRRRTALIIVIFYNLVGFADIASTMMALEGGAGAEANPIIRLIMAHAGEGWVIAKLALQGVITGMVLWFPHWIVLGLFTGATMSNAIIVYNNFVIAGVL